MSVETLKLLTSYLKIINPFLAAILSAWNAYDARDKLWRCAGLVASTALLLLIGVLAFIHQ